MPHITCRDRNLIGLQSHLMGLNALGLHDILAVTGDPKNRGFPWGNERVRRFFYGVDFVH